MLQNTGNVSGSKNIIAAQTIVRGDLRFLSDAQKAITEKKMRDITMTSLSLTNSQLSFHDIMPAMPEIHANRVLLAQFSAISTNLGGKPLLAVFADERGGAAISYIAQYVSASIDGLGPRGKGAHSQNETLDVSSLP